uniref:SR-related CTD-associated factor 4b n=1 Tax=Sphaeramia orbicularis TaxID=375764 RepID=A0A673CC30_9TELE
MELQSRAQHTFQRYCIQFIFLYNDLNYLFFNTHQLFSMIDMKPPISRAKMMSVTKSAIKAIKLYKHVVQIVEKFIKKCKPELKVPGLYVVDSIVRQSRHQFGVDKDVFGPRFLKNFTDTFQNLYRCPEDDKSKIVRVLNLWQKNGVFDMDIIQPLMDMASGAIVAAPAVEDPTPVSQGTDTSAAVVHDVPQLPNPDALAAVAQLFQSPHGQELQRMLQNFQQADKTLAATIANSIGNPSQMPAAQLNQYSSHTEKKSSLAEKLLDRFDYDDEPEDTMATEGSLLEFSYFNLFVVCVLIQTYSICTFSHDRGIAENILNQFPGQMPSQENVHPHMMGQTGGIEVFSYIYLVIMSSLCLHFTWQQMQSETIMIICPVFTFVAILVFIVCSTTLWVGQLDKRTQQADVMSFLEEFGQIESINMIPPRGCAYIVMVHRQDAYTALNKLSRGSYKVNQKPVKIAWALNKGIKVAHKKFWDVERGVTYIPWSKVKVEELESYQEGGMLDPETLFFLKLPSLCVPTEWGNIKDLNKQTSVNGAVENMPTDGTATAHIQVILIVFTHLLFNIRTAVRALIYNLTYEGCNKYIIAYEQWSLSTTTFFLINVCRALC